jgi:hypothetical protein
MNIWTGLLFLEGAVADPSLARELAADVARETQASTASAHNAPPVATRDTAPAGRWFTGAGQH